VNIDSDEVIKAIDYLKSNNHDIEPRKMWPMGVEISSSRKIPPSYQMEFGKVLCSFGDAGWGKDISKQKYVEEQFSEEIINASAKLISNWLINDKQKLTLTYIPSIRRPELVKDFASALAEKLNLPILELLKKSNDDFPSQKNLENSRFQCENVLKSITAVNNCDVGDILLIDDMVDSRWTFTVATYLLKMNGAGKVFPFAIAKTSGSDGGD
jgi:ATP-dependent DNA helicase RecQ